MRPSFCLHGSNVTLIYLAVAWLAGIALARPAGLTWWLWLLLAIPAIIGLILSRQQPVWRAAFACALLFTLGGSRISAAIPRFDKGDLAAYNDQGFVTIEGLIADAPDVRDTHINLRVRAETILTGEEGPPRAVEGLVLIQAPRTETYHYGDPVRIQGELRTPPELDTFSYRDYLAREGVYSIMPYARIEVTGPRRGNPLRAAMLDFRESAHQIIVRLLPDPQASLLSGILLGIESDISPDVREAFNTVSATHVIVISGSNLVVLAGVIQSLARRIVRKSAWVAAITIMGIVFYAVFVGGDPAVIRAAIMTALALVATELGRWTYGLASLSFAALLMTLINPFWLWDVGFQLSFLATLGVVLYVEPVQRFLTAKLSGHISQKAARGIVYAISDTLIVTVAAQITTTPLIACTFERFSVLSLPVNLLIVPAQPPLMVLGGLGVLSAMLIWPMGQAFAWGSWLFLTWTVTVVRSFARLPFAAAEISGTPHWVIWGMYTLMFGLTFFALQTEEDRARVCGWLRQVFSVRLLAFAGLIAAMLLFVGAASLPDGRLHVTFVDVGEGDAALIQTPSGRQILVDAGGSGRRLSAALGTALPFWDRRLDLLILTQPTPAHAGALPALLPRYHFDAIMTNGVQPTGQTVQAIWNEVDEQGIPQMIAMPGMRVSVGDGVTLTVLHTQSDIPLNDEDGPGEPVVLLLTYRDAHILFPGDLTAEGEAALLRSGYMLDTTVLQVPRSGHRDSSGEAFLAATSPQVAVLSVEAGNRFNLPHEETLVRLQATGAVLYRTDQHGTVEMVTDGKRLWITVSR